MPRPQQRSSMRPPTSSRQSTFGRRGYSSNNSSRRPKRSAASGVAHKIIKAAETPLIKVDEQNMAVAAVDANAPVQAPAKVEETKPARPFSSFKLPAQVMTNLAAAGITTPSPIQDGTIDAALAGHDVIGLANTGTGKTAAFLIPLLEKFHKDPNQQALILAPTRELAMQISDELIKLGKGMGLKAVVATGGTNINPQITGLRRNPQLVIATPGRITDLMKRRAWDPRNCHFVVLDEVDRMLDIGFVVDIKRILSQLPDERQSLFFSATMPPEVKTVVAQFTKDPVTVSVKTRETAASVAQEVVRTRGTMQKMEVLQERLRNPEYQRVLIFGRTKFGVERLAKQLIADGFRVDSIHGDKSQGQRTRALRGFKEGRVQALVATDVAARGLDIPKVTHVINFDLPSTYEDYVHRIGRTGRADATGHAVTFVDASEHHSA